ncbi:MAG: UbiH/UbiF/VisC/COQ6 family ubiquinone biosynthesis hydroxylase [Rhodospirillaceae bacterium]|nr:UbiH/UbiF/VisC/COQ6 family ubiquinone biosynthesis hydroxylase [Rhodospirillaceae bacterium]
MPGQRVEIAIVGGGMVGGTLAIALAQAGVEVVLIDHADPAALTEAAHDGRTSAVASATHRLMQAVGLWSRLVPHAEPILDIRVSDGPSLLFLHYDHRELGEEPLGYIVENRAIRRSLQARLGGLDKLHVRAPASLARHAVESDGIALDLANGEAFRASLLIAADGSGSRLRQQAGIASAQWDYGQTAIVCTMGHDKPHRGIAHERFLPAGPFAVLPMTDDPAHGHRSSIVWTERTRSAPAMLGLGDADFSLELYRRFGPWLGDVRVIGGRWSYPLRFLHAETYVRPRFALVGDAAHTMHPIAGQGLNIGLRDVAALAEVLVEAKRLGLDLGAAPVLERYQRWRRFDNQVLLTVTDSLNRLFSNDAAPIRLARDLGIAAVNRLGPLKRLFMRHAMGTVGNLPRLLRGEAL